MTDYRDRILAGLLERVDARGDRLPPTPRRSTATALGLAALVMLVAVGAALALAGRPGGPDVVARAAAAIEGPADGVLHYRLVRHQIFSDDIETWQTTSAHPVRARIRAHGMRIAPGEREGTVCFIEASYVLSADQRIAVSTTWDAESGTAFRSAGLRVSPGDLDFPDPFAEIRRHLGDGALIETGRAELNGREAIRLEPRDRTGLPEHGRIGEHAAEVAYYVDSETYAPMRWVVSDTQHYDVEAFEYLPATTVNVALVSVEGAHPRAPVVAGAPPYRPGGCAGG